MKSLRSNDVISIPKTVQQEHIIENATAASIQLTQEDLDKLDQAFPKPSKKIPFDIV